MGRDDLLSFVVYPKEAISYSYQAESVREASFVAEGVLYFFPSSFGSFPLSS